MILKKKNLNGIEPSKKLANKLKGNKYFKIENKFLDQVKVKKKYDLIIMDNVFEHIEEPEKALHKIKTLMKSNSKLYIAVPNIFKFKNNFRDPFGHTINYYENNIKYLFRLNGFKINKMKMHYNYINFIASPVLKKEKLKINFKNDLKVKFKKVKKFVNESEKYKKKVLKNYHKHENNIKRKKLKVVLYGASNYALEFLKNTNLKKNIIFLVDSNSIYHYKKRLGYDVLPPKVLTEEKFDKILITSKAFGQDIKKKLLNIGINKNNILLL